MARLVRNARGFTLAELLIAVAVIGILAAIAVPLYGSVLTRARIAKAQADIRAIASAVTIYSAHCGGYPDNTSSGSNCPIAVGQSGLLPSALWSPQTNSQGQAAGPFITAAPTLPGSNWTGAGTSYKYSTSVTGSFLVCASGDGTAVDSNSGTTCP